MDSAKSDCAGTFAQAACPTAGRVGTCKVGLAGINTYKRYYSDAAGNQASCNLSAMGTGFLGVVEWIAN